MMRYAQTDINNNILNSILELLPTHDSLAIINELDALKNNKKLTELSHHVNDMGNNFLHLAVLHYKADSIKQFIAILGDDIFEMHLTTNNEGFTPLQLAQKLTFDVSEQPARFKQKNKIFDLLFPTAIEATDRCIKHAERELNPEELLVQFNIPPNTKLAENIKRGCDTVNWCSNRNIKSTTHPRLNRSNQNKKNKITTNLRQCRATLKASERPLLNTIDIMKQNKYWNCGEIADLTANYLYAPKNESLYKIKEINYYGYKFIVMLRDDAKEFCPKTWGIEARLIYVNWEFNSCLSFASHVLYEGSFVKFSETDTGIYFIINQNNTNDVHQASNNKKVNNDYTVKNSCLKNGDHAFTIIDDSVIVDGWLKKVIPITHDHDLFDQYLIFGNDPYDCEHHFLRRYNPHYHQMETLDLFNVRTQSDKDIESMENIDGELRNIAGNPQLILKNTSGGITNHKNINSLLDHAVHMHKRYQANHISIIKSGFSLFSQAKNEIDIVHLKDEPKSRPCCTIF